MKEDTFEFFKKVAGYDTLRLILCKKAILVEGDSDELVVQRAYMDTHDGRLPIQDGIDVMTVGGVTFKRYLEIAQILQKETAVVTDNDAKSERITEADSFNSSHDLQHIFMGATTDDWTWEICVYNVNKTVLDGMIEVQTGAKYLFHEKDYGAVPGKMLNNKVDVAYQMLTSGITFEAPQYIKDAIGWLRK